MLKITNIPPAHIQAELEELKADLIKSIPSKSEENILIATWNIRAFGKLTSKWEAIGKDSPKRDIQSLLNIIQIIKSFDIIAVQEVKSNIKCLRDTIHMLGSDWSFIMTDVTKGNAGNGERLAFIFNTKRAKLSGLACEIVIPKEQLDNNIQPNALDKQFARTPYAVGFKVKNKTFILLTLHVLFGGSVKERAPELKAIAEWMYDWAKQLKKWNQSLIILGDFNIARKGDAAYDAFLSKNLYIPEELQKFPRTVFKKLKLYDQIGWYKNSRSKSQINLTYKSGGIYDFRNFTLQSRNYTPSKLSYRISDHFPLWIEFGI